MLYYILYPLKDYFFFFNIFKYITLRSIAAGVTAFIISLILGPWLIKKLALLKVGENIRSKEVSTSLHDLQNHKKGTPTMGGILIFIATIGSTLLWANLFNRFIILAILSCVWLGVLGFLDDYTKLTKKRSRGLGARQKLIFQFIFGLIVGTVLFLDPFFTTKLDIPFLKNLIIDLGIFYILFVAFVITATSNAVNLTDGLDGLAIGCVIMAGLAFTVLSYVSGNINFSHYLLIPYIPGAGELTVFCASIVGAALGFLWFNAYPATIFMGDVGSLMLGGALGTVAVCIKKELLLGIVGGIFVIEAVSVILQVGSFKLRKKRIFRIAPLHHHFQMLGWQEPKVIVRFWIIASILAMLTLVTLKLR
ncbi:MAG: phospho-N-acetylmuramoyl-pentapeptide-transferase [Candidatus Omnitrophota bacterium]